MPLPLDRPQLLALDFDGVICDGLLEYFEAAWIAYSQLWNQPNKQPSPGLADSFYRLRPVIETGWEMPLLIEGLLQGLSEAEVLTNWTEIAQQLLQNTGFSPAQLAAAVDGGRDRRIATDLEGWLALHRFYPGVIKRLQTLQQLHQDGLLQLVIVSTKEGRFIKQLLARSGVELADPQIIGKEIKQPKAQTLQQLQQKFQVANEAIWFVEDRLATLLKVQQELALTGIHLFLADWGYNTAQERKTATQTPGITVISLETFAQWPEATAY